MPVGHYQQVGASFWQEKTEPSGLWWQSTATPWSWAGQEDVQCGWGQLLAAKGSPGPLLTQLSHSDGRGREDAELLPQGLHRLLPALLVVDVQDTAGVEPAPNGPGNQLGGQDLQLSGTNHTGGGSFDIHILLFSFTRSPP